MADGPGRVALEGAMEALSEGEKLIVQRQKLIKVADRSELGRAVVAEYQANDLEITPTMRESWAEMVAVQQVATKRRKLDAVQGHSVQSGGPTSIKHQNPR